MAGSYAVENADDELKAIATKMIESNNNDGVACWIKNGSSIFLF